MTTAWSTAPSQGASCATCARSSRHGTKRPTRPGRRPRPDAVPRGLGAAAVDRGQVARGHAPDTVLLLEHPPVITLGRRTEASELHIPPGAPVEIVETDRGGKSTY